MAIINGSIKRGIGEFFHQYRERRKANNENVKAYLKGKNIQPHYGPNRHQRSVEFKFGQMEARATVRREKFRAERLASKGVAS